MRPTRRLASAQSVGSMRELCVFENPGVYQNAPDCDAEVYETSQTVEKERETLTGMGESTSQPVPYSSAAEHIAKLDEERALRIAQRRQQSNPFLRVLSFVIPYGGLLSSGFNLASSSIGAGIISLPSAMNICGLGLGTIFLVVVGLFTVYSFNLMAIAGQRTGLRNYEQITQVLLGTWAGYGLAVLLVLMCIGGEISYVIAVFGMIKAFVKNSKTTSDYVRSTSGARLITSMIWLVCMLPLCLPKEINTLRYCSVFAIVFIIYFILCMIAHSGIKMHQRGGIPDDLAYFRTGNDAIQGLGIFMFAFICQINCFEIYEEMYKPSVKRLTTSAVLAVFLCFTVYFLSGLFGYLDFGNEVTDSILLYYNPIEDIWMAVAYVGIIFKVCVGYGLHMIPIRDAVYHFAKVDVKQIAWWKNAVLCTFIAFISLIGGLFIPRINTVFGVIGSLCGGFIGFVLPALMFMYSGNWSLQTVGWFHYIMTYLLLIVGVIGVVFGTIASIYGEVMAARS